MSTLKNYTRKDIAAIRSYLIDKTNEIVDRLEVGFWSDRNESDLGMVFIEIAAGVADMLNFNIDKNALECFLPTVIQRKNAKGILNLINYELKPNVSALTTGVFTLDEPLDFDLRIPRYFQVSYPRGEEGNIYYATKEECSIEKGDLTVTVPLIQGMVKVINLTVNDLLKSRILTINSTKVGLNTVKLIIGSTEWTQVEDVLYDDQYAEKFSVHENNDDRAYIEFGYYYKNFLPADKDTQVKIYYLDSEGENGAVSANMISEINDTIKIGRIDYAARLTVTNTDLASGGAERESIDTARIKAPRTVYSHGLMVTLNDYENFANDYPGILKSRAVDWTINSSRWVGVPYLVYVYLIPADKDTYDCSEQLLAEITEHMNQFKWASIKLEYKNTEYVDIDIKMNVYTKADKGNYVAIKNSVENALIEFFDKTKRSYGDIFTEGQFESIGQNSNPLIEYCDTITPNDVVKLSYIEFPRLGNLDIEVRGL